MDTLVSLVGISSKASDRINMAAIEVAEKLNINMAYSPYASQMFRALHGRPVHFYVASKALELLQSNNLRRSILDQLINAQEVKVELNDELFKWTELPSPTPERSK